MKQDFAIRLKLLRQEFNLTQKQFCELLGVKYRTYRYYESPTETTMPPYLILIMMVRYFDIGISDILGQNIKHTILKKTKHPYNEFELKSIFSIRIANARKRNDYTQQETANKLGIALRNYQAYETNATLTMPSYNTLIKICNMFNLSVDFFLGNTN